MEPHILIIEDDAELGPLFQELISESGLQCELVASGEQAIARLRDFTPGGVLLDIHLPGVSGLEVLNHIRSDKRLEHVFVAVVTADSMRAKQASSLADRCLIKPLDYADLQELTEVIKERLRSGHH